MAFTFFFRDDHTLNLVLDYLTPIIENRTHIFIWSAGCAMGQEPYTFALLFRERIGSTENRFIRIYATDKDDYDEYGPIITRGIYPKTELEPIPEKIREKYFFPIEGDQDHLQISDEIRQMVEFKKHNLLTYNPIKTGVHLIICKNVLLHFTNEEQIQVWNMFYHALIEGGLMLHEQTQKIPKELEKKFERVNSSAQIYRKIR